MEHEGHRWPRRATVSRSSARLRPPVGRRLQAALVRRRAPPGCRSRSGRACSSCVGHEPPSRERSPPSLNAGVGRMADEGQVQAACVLRSEPPAEPPPLTWDFVLPEPHSELPLQSLVLLNRPREVPSILMNRPSSSPLEPLATRSLKSSSSRACAGGLVTDPTDLGVTDSELPRPSWAGWSWRARAHKPHRSSALMLGTWVGGDRPCMTGPPGPSMLCQSRRTRLAVAIVLDRHEEHRDPSVRVLRSAWTLEPDDLFGSTGGGDPLRGPDGPRRQTNGSLTGIESAPLRPGRGATPPRFLNRP